MKMLVDSNREMAEDAQQELGKMKLVEQLERQRRKDRRRFDHSDSEDDYEAPEAEEDAPKPKRRRDSRKPFGSRRRTKPKPPATGNKKGEGGEGGQQ